MKIKNKNTEKLLESMLYVLFFYFLLNFLRGNPIDYKDALTLGLAIGISFPFKNWIKKSVFT